MKELKAKRFLKTPIPRKQTEMLTVIDLFYFVLFAPNNNKISLRGNKIV